MKIPEIFLSDSFRPNFRKKIREYNFGPEKKFEELHYRVLKIWFADAILVQDFSSNLGQNRPFKSFEIRPKFQFDTVLVHFQKVPMCKFGLDSK